MKKYSHKTRHLERTALYKEKVGLILYAYCIMDNYAHLLIGGMDVPLFQACKEFSRLILNGLTVNIIEQTMYFSRYIKPLLYGKDDYLLQIIRHIIFIIIQQKEVLMEK